MHCRQRCEVSGISGISDREPGGPLRSHPLSVGPPCAFGQLRKFRYRNRRVGEPEPPARPVRIRAAGRAAQCLPHPFGLGSTIHRAAPRGSNATDRHYNQSAPASRTVVMIASFVFANICVPYRAPSGGSHGRRHHSLCLQARVPAMKLVQHQLTPGLTDASDHGHPRVVAGCPLARLEHNPSSWNQLDGLCLLQQASPVRANPIRWNRARFHLIGFRSKRHPFR